MAPETKVEAKRRRVIKDGSIEERNVLIEDAVIQRALRIMESRLRTHGEALNSPRTVQDYLRLRLANREQEVFVVLFHVTSSLRASEKPGRVRQRRCQSAWSAVQ